MYRTVINVPAHASTLEIVKMQQDGRTEAAEKLSQGSADSTSILTFSQESFENLPYTSQELREAWHARSRDSSPVTREFLEGRARQECAVTMLFVEGIQSGCGSVQDGQPDACKLLGAPEPTALKPPCGSVRRKRRAAFSAAQYNVLNSAFAEDKFSGYDKRKQIAAEANLSVQQVRDWFANKRKPSRQRAARVYGPFR